MAYTVSEFFRKSIRLLEDHGVFEPTTSAERIFSHHTGLSRTELYAAAETIIYSPLIHNIKAALERRINGEPVAYIIGECEFYNIKLKIDKRVMIPRPETEILVDECIKLLRVKEGNLHIADIGAGSGNIAISLAVNLPDADLIAIDTEHSALELAKENARLNNVADRIDFTRGDLLKPLEYFRHKFDAIVSNPPYISWDDRDSLPVEVRKYEPEKALFCREDGLYIIRNLAEQAVEYLNAGGFLALEIGHNQGDEAKNIMRNHFNSVKLIKDYSGNDRIVIGIT
ncbi:MAG: peptide chain release factor N(5)-glutamine methyltransferase [candidate division Zixibacteria bacterium]|nr:peptide chain release factor N(5)-glutamine methyltransferase [candidate division Zixibacteria bacterium]